jgi:hypothetical protein
MNEVINAAKSFWNSVFVALKMGEKNGGKGT